MPITSGTLSAAKLAKAAAMLEEDEDDGEVKGGTSLNRKELFECEKCNKVRLFPLLICAHCRRSWHCRPGEKFQKKLLIRSWLMYLHFAAESTGV